MPTNLPPNAKKKWAQVLEAKNPREKLQLLQEFLSLVPRHKGTAKLCVQVKKQMTALREEIEERKRRRAGKGGSKFFIQKEGAAQIVLVGLTKAGKSSLLSAVTNAKVEISPIPYATKDPMPGIMQFQDIQFQVVEAPALMEGSAEGRAWGPQTLGLARNADGLALMVDLSQDPVKQLSILLNEMEKARIVFSRPKGRIEIERKFMGAGLRVIVIGNLIDCTMKDVEALLRSYRIADAVVKISGEVSLDDIEDAVFETTVYKAAVVVANKSDVPGSQSNLQRLTRYVGDRLPIVAVSCKRRLGLESLGRTFFEVLNIMRVYTKGTGEKLFSKKPFIMKKRSTVHDLGKAIHSDFIRRFSYAKVWGKRLVFSPQKVGGTFVLEDGDFVEIHAR